MAVDARVARRYSRALFGAAKQYSVVRAVEDDLNTIVSLLRTDANFRHFLIAPYTSREEKLAIVERIFSDRVTALTMQVLRVMLEKQREDQVERVRDEYVKLRRSDEGIVYATFSSAQILDDKQREAVVNALSKSIKKQVEADFIVDAHLIGGVRVAYENNVLDGTARGTLGKLRERLRYDLLKQI